MRRNQTCGDRMNDIWSELNRAFAGAEGTPLAAIRADLFFNLASVRAGSFSETAKNVAYPFVLAWRSCIHSLQDLTFAPGTYLAICDYAAEAGFGTLRPLLKHLAPVALVTNRASQSVLGKMSLDIATICIDDASFRYRPLLGSLWKRSRTDCDQLLDSIREQELRSRLARLRSLIRALLVRAYLYELTANHLLDQIRPKGIVLHNDFTTLSRTFVQAAQHRGIREYTLQHGFPSMEYFPTYSRHYLVWGPYFKRYMASNGALAETLPVVGAPRLDYLTSGQLKEWPACSPRLLFLSQTHSPLFTHEEHLTILRMLNQATSKHPLKIKLHPQEAAGIYANFPNLRRCILPAQTSLKEALAQHDVAISVNSTALCEAMLMRRVALQIYTPTMARRIGAMRLPEHFENAGALEDFLLDLKTRSSLRARIAQQQAILEDFVFAPGHGTTNVIAYIKCHSEDSAETESAQCI
jgi:hypothetical protein